MRSFNEPFFNLRRPSGWIGLAAAVFLAFVYGSVHDRRHRGDDACCDATSDVRLNRGEVVGAAVGMPSTGETAGAMTISTPEDHLRCAEERVRLAGAQMAYNKGDASEADRYREMSDAFRRDCPYNANVIGPADREISDARRRELQREGWTMFRD